MSFQPAGSVETGFDVQFVRQPMPVESKCIAITFFNTGTDTATVNNVPVIPGTSLVFDGNVGEYCTEVFNVSFRNVAATFPELAVIRKTYK